MDVGYGNFCMYMFVYIFTSVSLINSLTGLLSLFAACKHGSQLQSKKSWQWCKWQFDIVKVSFSLFTCYSLGESPAQLFYRFSSFDYHEISFIYFDLSLNRL